MRNIKRKSCLGAAMALAASSALTAAFLGASHILAGLLFIAAFVAVMIGMDLKSDPSDRPKEKSEEEKPKDDKLPLTSENLETLMPSTAELTTIDRQQLGDLIKATHERIVRNRENQTERSPRRSAEEIRQCLLKYAPLPVAPAQKEDPEAVPRDVFMFRKTDPDKISETLKNLEKVFPEYVRKGKKESPTSSAEEIAEILRGLVTEPESRAEIEELIRRTETQQPTKHEEEENPFDHSPYCSGDALPPKIHLFRRATEALPSESLRRQAQRLRKKAETIKDPEKKRLTLSEADECEQRARHQDSCPPFPPRTQQ